MKTVLLVEDSDVDIFLMKTACEQSGISHKLRTVADGEEAIAYLSGAGNFSDRGRHPVPALVFLDIKMPKRTGLEVLEWIRSRPEYKNLPVIMLTSSALLSDVNRAYQLGATSYLQKTSNPAEFGQAVKVILKYWLDLNITLDQV